jgi:predicted protein tyrosine phosphatase
MIIVCPLSCLTDTVAEHRARHVVTLLASGAPATPPGIEPQNHLVVDVDDICDPLDGYCVPDAPHIEALLEFAGRWDRTSPLVIHCWAGISRSTAAAFATACARAPGRDEAEIAMAIRRASPTAMPNARIVALADALLGRQGRMSRAIERIGPGRPAFEGLPFRLAVDG